MPQTHPLGLLEAFEVSLAPVFLAQGDSQRDSIVDATGRALGLACVPFPEIAVLSPFIPPTNWAFSALCWVLATELELSYKKVQKQARFCTTPARN